MRDARVLNASVQALLSLVYEQCSNKAVSFDRFSYNLTHNLAAWLVSLINTRAMIDGKGCCLADRLRESEFVDVSGVAWPG
jgi:hypothetical protein